MALIRNAKKLFAYRRWLDYYNNPDQRYDYSEEESYEVDKSMDECLKSRSVRQQISDACKEHKGYTEVCATAVLRSFDVFSGNGVSKAKQGILASHIGISLSTFNRYYRFLVDLGFLITKHRWTIYKVYGARQASNKTVLVFLIEYCKRCKSWNSSKHGVKRKNPIAGYSYSIKTNRSKETGEIHGKIPDGYKFTEGIAEYSGGAA